MKPLKCRFCSTPLKHRFADLGNMPLPNAFLKAADAQKEKFYPLQAYVCHECLLVQLGESVNPQELFSFYPYFSSYSNSWKEHTSHYTTQVIERFHLNSNSQVIEIASNDGCLLKKFKEKKIPVLGIEPAQNVAKFAQANEIPTVVKFFGEKTAQELFQKNIQADLLIGNNVLAHAPNINGFIKGLKLILKPKGVISLEFPHLLELIQKNQFDTIHYEHFFYFSLLSLEKIFKKHELHLFDIEKIPTHGGSIRLFLQHRNGDKKTSPHIQELKNKELSSRLDKIETYLSFQKNICKVKEKLLKLLEEFKKEKKKMIAYGASAKGNVLLNYCGINNNILDYIVDINPLKQNSLCPGSHIPVKSFDKIEITQPDYILILSWNLKEEIISQLNFIGKWGGKFIVPIPGIEIIS